MISARFYPGADMGDKRDVELLVEVGFKPVETIGIATANAAEYLGQPDRSSTLPQASRPT